ncbi:MAG: HTTM domain-containing protein [Flavobacteriaceae bacterium]
MRANYFKRMNTPVEAAPLAVFRILFGVLMFASILRFWGYGWIEKLYLEPQWHFSYYGFEWVKPLGVMTYGLFVICALSALMVGVGFKYRWAIILFFLSFTYIELMDKTTYLNHYYFISVLSFLMIFLPAANYFSWDAWQAQKRSQSEIPYGWAPRWTVDVLKVLLGMVYFYAGLAKLNSDWLLKAMPLKIWLPAKFDVPVIGDLMGYAWVHYAFSWGGALYDLLIPFLLLWKSTRGVAFFLVVVFHGLTGILFPIGMFPYIMIVSTLIFFDSSVHRRIIFQLSRLFRLPKTLTTLVSKPEGPFFSSKSIFKTVIYIFMGVQLLFPWRYLLYPGELFWTEEGYRFSWRVMLMEKSGYAQFKVVNGATGKRFYVDNSDFLSPFQEKQMSFQPDFILEYAHMLRDHFQQQGHRNIEIYVESSVALNGRLSRPLIDPNVDLAQEKESFAHKTWILPFKDAILGL